MLLSLVVKASQMYSRHINWQGLCWEKFCQVHVFISDTPSIKNCLRNGRLLDKDLNLVKDTVGKQNVDIDVATFHKDLSTLKLSEKKC